MVKYNASVYFFAGALLIYGVQYMIFSDQLSLDNVIQGQLNLQSRSTETRGTGAGNNTSTQYKVPNIVHYIWFKNKRENYEEEFRFVYYLSMRSAHALIKPEVIYFHTDAQLTGKYWEMAKNISSVKIIHRDPPRELFGEVTKEPTFRTSDSNIARLQVLLEYGGIYLDLDVIVVRSFDPFRYYSATVGYEFDNGRVCGGIILACKNSTFLYLWANSYVDDYKVGTWAYNSGEVPGKLARRFPHLVHVENQTLHRPNWAQLDMIYGPQSYNWTRNYAVHLWYTAFVRVKLKQFETEPDLDNVKQWGGVLGEISQYILRTD